MCEKCKAEAKIIIEVKKGKVSIEMEGNKAGYIAGIAGLLKSAENSTLLQQVLANAILHVDNATLEEIIEKQR